MIAMNKIIPFTCFNIIAGLFMAFKASSFALDTQKIDLDYMLTEPKSDEERLIEALIFIESANNPKAFQKRTGARGLTQIRAIAWKDLVKNYPEKYKKLSYRRDIYKPEIAREAGRDYLNLVRCYLKKKNKEATVDNVLAAYNWGIGNLHKRGLKNAPRETVNYIRKIKSRLNDS